MRKFILSIASLMVILASLTSCLGDGTEFSYYEDAAITSFKLGTLKRHVVKKSYDGIDSIAHSTINCSRYVFQIDQQKGEIWNADSLPMGTDPTKVVCTIDTKNGGSIAIKSLTSDSLNAYDSKDSIDFSSPRTFTIFSNSILGKRVYNVHVNIHQEVGDTCTWTNMVGENANIGALTSMKLITLNNNLLLFGNNNGEAKVYTTDINDGKTWTAVTTTPTLDADASKNVVEKGGILYTISGGNLLCSTDGASWQTINATTHRQIVAASTARLYALSVDSKLMASTDNGNSWTEEKLDADASLLPTEGISYIVHPMEVNGQTDRIILIGNRSHTDYPTDMTATVWTKVDEYADGARQGVWNHIEFNEINNYKAPRGANWQLINYDGCVKGICGKIEGASDREALACIYTTSDDGITWHNDSSMELPRRMTTSKTDFAMATDANNMVWIVCGETGQVWKGRINRVSWEVNKK